jgi:SAM-dependent methyltransferase
MGYLERFTGRANDYVAGRPSYPNACFELLFSGLGGGATIRVVDLGAGTGISSRLLAAHGAEVIAVEPNAAMREGAAAAPNVTWVARTAEDTGLPDASADLVTAFQAFHWFDAEAAIAEMRRLLRPAGRAALVYNERDERDPFTAAYGDLVRRHAIDRTESRRGYGRTAFEQSSAWAHVRVTEFENEQILDRAGVHARALSTSYLPNAGPAADALHAAIDEVFDRYASDRLVTMHLKTIVTIRGDSVP